MPKLPGRRAEEESRVFASQPIRVGQRAAGDVNMRRGQSCRARGREVVSSPDPHAGRESRECPLMRVADDRREAGADRRFVHIKKGDSATCREKWGLYFGGRCCYRRWGRGEH